MSRERFWTDSTSIRTALKRGGDLEVGAWVRRRRRKRLLMSLGGLLLVAMAVMVYATLRVDRGVATRDGYREDLQCISCGHQFSQVLKFGQKTPLICPKCGERAAKPVWVCREHGHRFVPNGPVESISCPICGSRNVGSAAAARASTQPSASP